ncbi:flagellar brake protein [Halopseudomonas nanhaiensis]|uniref:flagellar brake protein n=1 Tax=Halopseudomonas nanhaiensis TaxID=2830842 RepID=UPI001CBCD7E0|nr:flagellar brake protein [Halopseudomonas nanhaiensis]UAW98394.1 flagellar brake protein [Halopseudomonas nanhaiensis]
MPLIMLKDDEVALDTPLPWNLLDAEGTVLFRESSVIDNPALLAQLLKLGLYRCVPLSAEADKPEPAAPEVQTCSMAQIQLAPGDPVQLQSLHGHSTERYQVRMIGVHAPVSLMVTAPTLHGRLVFIKEGQQFLVRGFVGKDAVAYRTRVLKSQLTPYPYLHLAYPETVQSMRIRSSARVTVNLVASTVAPCGPGAARIVDLSLGGARMLSRSPIADKDDEIKVSFRINPSGLDVYLTLRGRVRAVQRQEEGTAEFVATGVEFHSLSEQERLYLTNMVYQNLLKDTV